MGSEGSAGLSLVPIKDSTKGQLAMISERERTDIMDSEIRKAEREAAVVVLIAGDEGPFPGGDPLPHSPALHGGTPSVGVFALPPVTSESPHVRPETCAFE